MNLKKFISGVSALAIAASAFAGMAVTANAGYSCSNEAVELYNSSSDKKVAFTGKETGTIGNLFYSVWGNAAGNSDALYYSDGVLLRFNGPNASRYITYTAPCRGVFKVSVKAGTNSSSSSPKPSYTVIEHTVATTSATTQVASETPGTNSNAQWTPGTVTMDSGDVVKVYMPEKLKDGETKNEGSLQVLYVQFTPKKDPKSFSFSGADSSSSYNAISATISKTDKDEVRHSETKTAKLDTILTGDGEYYLQITDVPYSVSISDVKLIYVD